MPTNQNISLNRNAPQRRRRLSRLFPLLLLVALVAGGGYLLFRDTDPPGIQLTPETEIVALGVALEVHVEDAKSGLKRVQITLAQDGRVKQRIDKAFPSETDSYAETIHLDKDNYSDGPFEVSIEAEDASLYPFGSGGESELTRTYLLDATKPGIETGGGLHYMDQGGASVIRYTANEKLSRSGVTVAGRFFPAYQQADGSWLCLFAMPWDTPPGEYKPVITAVDLAGNENTRGFRVQAKRTRYRSDTLNIPDSFLESKVELFHQEFPNDPEGEPLAMYLKLNNDLRAQNAEELLRIGLKTSPTPLWEGAFLRNAGKRTAGFGDKRDYMYQGQVVDHQTHLGVDLADKAESPILAANTGTVVFAGFLGIYGNAVIIDHGLGLQSLYSHLSQIETAVGHSVAKGEQIGLSGKTGLAGGDHLHFGMLISGVPVEPKEWWDDHWIKDNIDVHME